MASTEFEPKAGFLTTPYKCDMAKQASVFGFIKEVNILKYM